MTTTCTSCGADFTPAPDAYRGGTWRTCTRCRDGPTGEVSGVTEADANRSQVQITRPKCQVERNEHHDQRDAH